MREQADLQVSIMELKSDIKNLGTVSINQDILTWICCLLLLVVMNYLILVGHLHVLILHVITAAQ